ncbi:MAG: hypothetical protein ACREBS_05010 [Nitrososphaerales archaeon]
MSRPVTYVDAATTLEAIVTFFASTLLVLLRGFFFNERIQFSVDIEVDLLNHPLDEL